MRLGVSFYTSLSKRLFVTSSSSFSEQISPKIVEKGNTIAPKPKSKISTLFVPGHCGHEVYQIVKPFIDVSYFDDHSLKDIRESCELRGIRIDFGIFVGLAQKWKQLKDSFSVLENKNAEYVSELRRLNAENKPEEETRLNVEHLEFLKEYKVVKNKLYDVEDDVMPLFQKLPNRLHPETPQRADISHYSHEVRNFNFRPLSHVAIGENQQNLEFSPVSPTAYYFKGELSLLDIALQYFFAHQLSYRKFTNMICTDFCKSFIIEACGNDPHSLDHCIPLKTKGQFGGQRLNLIGPASLESFCAYLTNMNVSEEFLPAKYFCCGRFYDSSMRSCSPGSLFTVLQSSKIQCLILSKQHEVDLGFEELMNIMYSCYCQLGLPFRMRDISARHLNVTESRRVQFEVWSPHSQKYFPCGHVSCRDDFISKRLRATYGIDYKVHGYLHMVEATAGKVPSLIACIMENFQKADGSFVLPEVLKKYMLI